MVLSLRGVALGMHRVTLQTNTFLHGRHDNFSHDGMRGGGTRSCISCMSGRSRHHVITRLQRLLPRTKFVTRRNSNDLAARGCY